MKTEIDTALVCRLCFIYQYLSFLYRVLVKIFFIFSLLFYGKFKDIVVLILLPVIRCLIYFALLFSYRKSFLVILFSSLRYVCNDDTTILLLTVYRL